MTIRALGVCLFIACLWACTQAPPEAPAEQTSTLGDEAPIFAVAATREPTPAMLEAALSGDPVAMSAAASLLGTCHAATTCPGYGACTSWSTLAYCNDTCTKRCCHDGPSCNEPDIGGTVYRQRYRVCFNPAGASCTEWNIQSEYVCGC
jgi:hypothetical protein